MKISLRFGVPLILIIFSVVLGIHYWISSTARANNEINANALSDAAAQTSRLQGTLERLIQSNEWSQAQIEIGAAGLGRNLELSLLTDENGKVLYSTEPAFEGQAFSSVLPKLGSSVAPVIEDIPNIQSPVRLSLDGNKVVALYPILMAATDYSLRPSAKGKLLAVYDLSRVKSESGQHIRIQAMRYSLVLGMLAMLLALFFHFFLTRRVNRIIEVSGQFAKGDYAARVRFTMEDEIGTLGKAFDGMAEKLYRSHEELEKKVRERTAELAKANEDLERQIRERKQLEAAVRQSEKMAAIGQLAGGVAHEINNPLGVILGFAQSVVKRIPSGDNMELPLKSIEREAMRCKQLVQDLLTFSRIGKIEKESMDVHSMIDSSLSLIRAQSKVRDVSLEKGFAPELPKILANANQLQQVIVNLCSNAMDAMPRGGTLTVKTRQKKSGGQEGVEIEIQDTGTGIPEEIRSRIFEPFFTTKEAGKGTGLGLSLVYEIIQKHGGQISVESDMGKGTRFLIFLPHSSPPAASL